MKFKPGDKVKLVTDNVYARTGATATVQDPAHDNVHGEEFLNIKWDRDNKLHRGQCDGHYYEKDFMLVETSGKTTDMNLRDWISIYDFLNGSSITITPNYRLQLLSKLQAIIKESTETVTIEEMQERMANKEPATLVEAHTSDNKIKQLVVKLTKDEDLEYWVRVDKKRTLSSQFLSEAVEKFNKY